MDFFRRIGRRGIIQSGVQLLAAALWPGPRTARGGPEPGDRVPDARFERMDSLAGVVLPGALTDEQRRAVVTRFGAWLDGFAPGLELMATEDTAFLMELPFSRPMHTAGVSPVSRYDEQLEALDEEARERRGVSFAWLDRDEQTAIVREVVESAVARLRVHDLNPVGAPALWLAGPAAFVGTDADHVAIALMAFYFNSADGVGRSMGRVVDPRTCRGFDGIERPPRERET